MTKPRAEPGEQVENLDALEHNVTAAAEAAATAAAHAVAAARAAEEISRAREEAEARAAKADTAEVETSSETPDLNAESPEKQSAHVGNGTQMTRPDLVPLASDAETEPSVPKDEAPAGSADEEFGDLLNFDAPHVATSSVLTRLALIALGAAAALLLVSFLLLVIVPKGMGSDVVVLASWLGIAVLSMGGFALLVGAGITKVIRSGDRT